MKKIRLTVEWDGACSEFDWGQVLSDAIEKFDVSGVTRVTDVEHVTSFGTTEKLTLAIDQDPHLVKFRERQSRALHGSPL